MCPAVQAPLPRERVEGDRLDPTLQEAAELPRVSHPWPLARDSRWQQVPLGELPSPTAATGCGSLRAPRLAQAPLQRCNLASSPPLRCQ